MTLPTDSALLRTVVHLPGERPRQRHRAPDNRCERLWSVPFAIIRSIAPKSALMRFRTPTAASAQPLRVVHRDKQQIEVNPVPCSRSPNARNRSGCSRPDCRSMTHLLRSRVAAPPLIASQEMGPNDRSRRYHRRHLKQAQSAPPVNKKLTGRASRLPMFPPPPTPSMAARRAEVD